MTRRFLTAIPRAPEVDAYVPADAELRVEQHREDAAGAARGWPIRLTRCGEPPGLWGDTDRPVTVEPSIGAVIIAETSR